MNDARSQSAQLEAGTARSRRRLLASASLLAAAAAVIFTVFWLIDYYLASPTTTRPGPFHLLAALDEETLANALGSLAQVIVAVLAIAITVVSIVVQLAATRYTSRIADMFFHDPTNLAMLGFFVVACIDAVWVSLAVSRNFVPRVTVGVSLAMVTGSLLLLVPYFAHVFDFLDPEKVIVRIGEQALRGAFPRRPGHPDLSEGQAQTSASLEHLADVAVNAVAQKDKVIASHAVAELREVMVQYLAGKRELPARWFLLGPRIRQDPDFIALSPDSLGELEAQRTWLEWKGLRHLRTVFAESLDHLPELSHVVAIETRYVGESALSAGDRAVSAVTVKFFNTFLRTALNGRDVRASYNVLHQYRQLAERLMADGLDEEVAAIGRHFRYYAQIAHALDIGFVTETAAYDLRLLCQRAFETKAACHDELLQTFLEVDKEPDAPPASPAAAAAEKTLRGVRKAQVKLATFYLLRGAEHNARLIFQDMRFESPARLASILAELLAIAAKDFWEVTDRGVNFDYLDEQSKSRLSEFFGWFGEPESAVLR
jgi:predicted membrane protein DUF2254